MENTCSTECLDIIHLPEEEQKALRRGIMNGNMIFKKGKSDKLNFKKTGEAVSDVTLAKVKPVTKKIRKSLVGKGEHYYPKAGVGQFVIENQELRVGDKILISGPTTGQQEVTVTEMKVNGKAGDVAVKGDKVTMSLPFRIRLSDKLFKILG
jgi:UPF0176 protein